MGNFNLLSTLSELIQFGADKIDATNLNWLGKVIQWLFEGIGIVGVGVIVFTLILKTIVLPLDIYSRVKTKKQSLIMEKMRPQMEKLQKQYENDKNMYSQKVMELQKQNGYSMFAACIPMIVSLVIFMVVFSAFSTYSQYANLTAYNNMVDSYNAAVQQYVLTDLEGNTVYADGFLIEMETPGFTDALSYDVDLEKFVAAANGSAESKARYATAAEGYDLSLENFLSSEDKVTQKLIIENFIKLQAREDAATYYRENRSGFIWVRSIWYPDSMLNKEVPTFDKFSSAITRAVGKNIDSSYEESYNEVTYNLGEEKSAYNGYFVLIVLAIGLMFLQQFIMMRSQKAASELGTVDGSGAKTNKWMMILMPIFYGIFSFFYSAAFSIYMITNTCYSLVTTLIINKAVDVKFKKNELKQEKDRLSKRATNNRKRLK